MRFNVLIVLALILMTVFAAYSVVYTQGLQTESQSIKIIGVYSLEGSYGYVATLRPNQRHPSAVLARRFHKPSSATSTSGHTT